MKRNLLSSVILSLLCVLFFSGFYPLVVWSIAQCAPNKGKGFIIAANGKHYYDHIGQKFTDDKYFSSRPSAVDYNAAGSGGSNKGPSNPDYLATVQARIDTFMVHNPGIQKSMIPSELVTASGSGLDPHISVPAALVQIPRIAKVRGLDEARIKALVAKETAGPLAGIAGPRQINVLRLNLKLDLLPKP